MLFKNQHHYQYWNNQTSLLTQMGRLHRALQSLSKENQQKLVALNVQSLRSEFKRTGKAVGVILKPFKIFPSPPFFFFWHLHIKLCGCWSNPLLCQSSCSASAWKHSETACFHFSRGKAGLCFKSRSPPDVP